MRIRLSASFQRSSSPSRRKNGILSEPFNRGGCMMFVIMQLRS
jgi:hypothetical protein